jgi:hypothetical protein
MTSTDADRRSLEERVQERVTALDNATLEELDDLLARIAAQPVAAEPPTGDTAVMTRRQALAAFGVGTLALVGSNIVTGRLAYGAGEGVASAGAQLELAKSATEAARLRGLLKLYEALEGIGIDALISAGIRAVKLPLDAIQFAASGMRNAIKAVDGLLGRFEAAIPGVINAIDTAENNLRWLLDDRLEALGRAVNQATERVEPVAEGLGRFFNGVLERIPGSLGDRVREIVGRLRELVAALPVQLRPVRDGLLKPLRQDWFAPGDAGLQGQLFTPIRQNLLNPLDGLLNKVNELTQRWEADLTAPVQQAILQRDAVRKEITAYRTAYNLPASETERA